MRERKSRTEDFKRSRSGSREDERRRNKKRTREERGSKRSDRKEVAVERWGKEDEPSTSDDNNARKSNSQGEKSSIAKPDFGLSGKLLEEVNSYKGVVIKYSQPPEARIPKTKWRLYQFKGDEALPTLYIHRQSAYLIGRDRKIVDFAVDHPSCSKQHAVLQYRLLSVQDKSSGRISHRIRPYLIDLESANGTYINNKKVEPKKYYQLIERDVIKFGYSTREYVLLHEHSKGNSDESDNSDIEK